MEMRGFVIPHWSTPPELLQFFKLKICHSSLVCVVNYIYIYIIYIFIGVNGNEGVCYPTLVNSTQTIAIFQVAPLVSYKFRPPPPPHLLNLHFFCAFEKSDIAFSFLLSNSSSRVIHSALCVRNLPAFEVPLHH